MVLWHWQHFAYIGPELSKDFNVTFQPFYALLRPFYEDGARGAYYFFLLSGFIFFWRYQASIAGRRTPFSLFWVQRLSRLYPLHLVTLLLVAGLQGLYIARAGAPFVYRFNDAYHFLLNLGFASTWGFQAGLSFNGPVWSVSVEILLYLVFFGVAFLRLGRLWFCLAVAALALTLAGLEPDEGFMVGAGLFFLGGFVYQATYLVSTRWPKLKPAIHLLAGLAWLLTFINFYVFNFAPPLRAMGVRTAFLTVVYPNTILFPLTVGSLALLELDLGSRFLKPFSWVGDITYASYLLHFPLQLVASLAVSYGWLSRDFYLRRTSLAVFFLILIPLSYLTYVRFERPVQAWLRRKFARRAEPGAEPSLN